MEIIILRGISGAGKSTYIKNNISEEGRVICSADNFFYDEAGNYNFDPSMIQKAHSKCFLTFLEEIALQQKKTIIVDNTNTQLWEISPYVAACNAFNCPYRIVRLSCSPEKAFQRNAHGVPLPVIQSMLKRFENLPSWWVKEEEIFN